MVIELAVAAAIFMNQLGDFDVIAAIFRDFEEVFRSAEAPPLDGVHAVGDFGIAQRRFGDRVEAKTMLEDLFDFNKRVECGNLVEIERGVCRENLVVEAQDVVPHDKVRAHELLNHFMGIVFVEDAVFLIATGVGDSHGKPKLTEVFRGTAADFIEALLRLQVKIDNVLHGRWEEILPVSDQHTQYFQVCDVLAILGTFRGFEDLWDFRKGAGIQDLFKRFDADVALADVLMTVNATAKTCLGIVEVEAENFFKPQKAVEFLQRIGKAPSCRNIVTSGKDMAGINAKADTRRHAHLVIDLGEVLEAVADRRALSCRRFQGDFHFFSPRFFQDRLEILRNGVNGRLLARAHVVSRMKNQKGQPEEFGTLELIGKSCERTLGGLVAHSAKVDEIAGMAADGQFEKLGAFAEQIGCFFDDLGGLPLEVVFGKNLQRLAACVHSAFPRLDVAARHRHVGSDIVEIHWKAALNRVNAGQFLRAFCKSSSRMMGGSCQSLARPTMRFNLQPMTVLGIRILMTWGILAVLSRLEGVGLLAGIFLCLFLGLVWGPPLAGLFGSLVVGLYSPSADSCIVYREYSIAEARVKQGLYVEAVDAYEAYKAEDPSQLTPYLRIAELQVAHFENYPAAVAQLRSALAFAQSCEAFTLIQCRLADLLVKSNYDPRAALDGLHEVQRRYPGTSQAKLAEEKAKRILDALGDSTNFPGP